MILGLGVAGLRATHASWLAREVGSVASCAGWIARACVLAGALALVSRARGHIAASPGWARPARGAFYAGVSYLAALCLAPFDGSVAVMWAVAAGGLFVLGLALADAWSEARPRLVRSVDVVLANVCLSLAGLELGLTLLGAVTHMPLLALEGDDRGRSVWEWRRGVPGSEHLGFPFNAWGDYDGPPRVLPAESCSVVSIGDSFAVGVVPLPYHFTSVAEANGDCDVYNMGASSVGPPEYLYMLRERAITLDPDAVVVNLYLFNDAYDVERLPADRPPWIARDRRRVYRVGERLLSWSRERAATGRPVGAAPAGRSGSSIEERFPWVLDPMREEPTFSAEAYLTLQTEYAWRVLRPHLPEWEDFVAVLSEMIEVAGARLLFTLIPAEPQVEDDLWAEVQRRAEGPLERDGIQRRVREWLAARGVPVLDLLPVLRAAEPLSDGRRHVFHLRDTHLNARGNALAGRALARFLEEHVRP